MKHTVLVEESIQKLQECDLYEIVYSTTVREINGKIVCYANLLIEKETGKILNLTPSHKVLWREDSISTPVAINSKDIFEKPSSLELAQLEDLQQLSSSSQETLKSSLEAFNKLLQSQKKTD